MSSIAHIKGTLIKIVSCTTINHAQYLTSIASNEPAEQIAQKAKSSVSLWDDVYRRRHALPQGLSGGRVAGLGFCLAKFSLSSHKL